MKAGVKAGFKGIAVSPGGIRSFRLYKPPPPAPQAQGGAPLERLPLVVMLHGCGQDAAGFAASTRMNLLAARERFFVLYVEQDRLANAQGCWNWFETRSGRAFAEESIVLAAIDQVSLLNAVDPSRTVIAGLSAGASMAALIASRHPARFKAVVMHSGVPPGAAHSALSALGAMRGHGARHLAAAAAASTSIDSARPEPRPSGVSERTDAAVADWPALLVIQGRADRVVDPSNALAAASFWLAHAAAARAGSRQAAARPTPPRTLQRGRRHPSTITEWKQGGRTFVTLCEVSALGHAWSGGHGSQPFGDAEGPDASRMIWAFAQRQWGSRP